jgi:hypothetical protein
VHASRHAEDGTGILDEYATDAAGTWVGATVASAAWPDAELALDATDTVHLGFLRADGLVHAWGAPGAWSTEVVAPAATCDASLALDARDGAHALFRLAAPPELRYAARVAGAWPSERVDEADLACGVTAARLALAVESDGTAHAAYAAERGVVHAVRRAGGWDHETIDATTANGVALALEGDGTPHVVFVDSALALWHVRREPGGTWTRTRVDPEAQVATPALALDALGGAHVAWFQASYGGELRYATDASGTWRVVAVAPAVYADVAAALAPGGALLVGYFDAGGARVAVRANADLAARARR